VFLINSRYPLVCVIYYWLPSNRPSFSRSYGCNLPSSFSVVISNALVFSTCPPVSVWGTVYVEVLFPGRIVLHSQSIKQVQNFFSVTSSRFRNINLIPIDYAFQPRLRGRLTLRRLALRQETLDFRRECFSHSLSLLMSAFSLPIPPTRLASRLQRPTERSATTCQHN
jgi:hypothetical protein